MVSIVLCTYNGSSLSDEDRTTTAYKTTHSITAKLALLEGAEKGRKAAPGNGSLARRGDESMN